MKTKQKKKIEKIELACDRCGKTPVKFWIDGQIYLCDKCLKEMNVNEKRVIQERNYKQCKHDN